MYCNIINPHQLGNAIISIQYLENKTILNAIVWPPEYILFMYTYPHSYQVNTLSAYHRDLAEVKNLRQRKNSVTDVTPCYWERRYLESNLEWTDIDYGSNLDYWLEDDVNNEIVIVDREDSSPKQKSLEIIEDHGLDNWVSDDEESLQMYKVHPEVITDHHHLESWSDRVNTESDKDKIPYSNHLSHSSSSTSSHKDLSGHDMMITVDSPTVDTAPVPNLV